MACCAEPQLVKAKPTNEVKSSQPQMSCTQTRRMSATIARWLEQSIPTAANTLPVPYALG